MRSLRTLMAHCLLFTRYSLLTAHTYYSLLILTTYTYCLLLLILTTYTYYYTYYLYLLLILTTCTYYLSTCIHYLYLLPAYSSPLLFHSTVQPLLFTSTVQPPRGAVTTIWRCRAGGFTEWCLRGNQLRECPSRTRYLLATACFILP